MADREFTSPIPRTAEVPPTMLQATRKWERIALKWRNLAEQRRDHHVDLYKSGRWKHYYTDEEFLTEMRQAVALAERWAEIAPSGEERGARPRNRAAGGGCSLIVYVRPRRHGRLTDPARLFLCHRHP